jgi:hypothetical protein
MHFLTTLIYPFFLSKFSMCKITMKFKWNFVTYISSHTQT